MFPLTNHQFWSPAGGRFRRTTYKNPICQKSRLLICVTLQFMLLIHSDSLDSHRRRHSHCPRTQDEAYHGRVNNCSEPNNVRLKSEIFLLEFQLLFFPIHFLSLVIELQRRYCLLSVRLLGSQFEGLMVVHFELSGEPLLVTSAMCRLLYGYAFRFFYLFELNI